MTDYIYDIHLGHYVPVNNKFLFEGTVTGTAEGETTASTKSTNTTSNTKLTLDATLSVLNNLETSDIVLMRQDMLTKLQNILKDILQKNSNINLVTLNIAKLQKTNAALNKINLAQKQLLQAQLDLENKKFEYHKIENEEMKKILAAQAKIVESYSLNINKNYLPEKYKFLFNSNDNKINESNVLHAKVYVDKLIKDDSAERIKGMVDFKNAFKDSDLLYGKDKEGGYFAVCVDQEDFNKLVGTLEEAGFYKEDILALCLSLIFDRSELVK